MQFEIYIITEESYPKWWNPIKLECNSLDEAIIISENLVKEKNQHLVERQIYVVGE